MKKSVLFLFGILGVSIINAQFTGQAATYTTNADGGVSDALYNYATGSISDKYDKSSFEDGSIVGSPYSSNTFLPAQLYYGDEVADNIYYRYNAYNEEVEIKQKNLDEEPIRGLSKDKKIKVVSLGKALSFKTFVDKNGNTKNGYLTLLASGDYKLYQHLKVTFKEAKKAENSFVQNIPAKFSQSTEYYLEVTNKNRIDQVELSNKKIIQLVDDEKANELKTFLKENKIKVRDVNDLYTVINFLNGNESEG